MPQPAQHPPQPVCVGAARVVVHHYLRPARNAPIARRIRKHFHIGQWMPAGDAGHDGREILIEVGVYCTGDVRLQILPAAQRRIGQREATVHDGPVG